MLIIFSYLHLLNIIQIINANNEEGSVRMLINPKNGAFMVKSTILSVTNPTYPFSVSLFRLIVMNELMNKPNAVVKINVAMYSTNSIPLITVSLYDVEHCEFILCL